MLARNACYAWAVSSSFIFLASGSVARISNNRGLSGCGGYIMTDPSVLCYSVLADICTSRWNRLPLIRRGFSRLFLSSERSVWSLLSGRTSLPSQHNAFIFAYPPGTLKTRGERQRRTRATLYWGEERRAKLTVSSIFWFALGRLCGGDATKERERRLPPAHLHTHYFPPVPSLLAHLVRNGRQARLSRRAGNKRGGGRRRRRGGDAVRNDACGDFAVAR